MLAVERVAVAVVVEAGFLVARVEILGHDRAVELHPNGAAEYEKQTCACLGQWWDHRAKDVGVGHELAAESINKNHSGPRRGEHAETSASWSLGRPQTLSSEIGGRPRGRRAPRRAGPRPVPGSSRAVTTRHS